MNVLYLNNDYCYSLEDLRAIINQCAIIGPKLDNPLIIELLCALKDDRLKAFLEVGSDEEKLIADQLPDYKLCKDDDTLINAIFQCFDKTFQMKQIAFSDYIELVSVGAKIDEDIYKEIPNNHVFHCYQGNIHIELLAKFKIKKRVGLNLSLYLQYDYANEQHTSDVKSINLMDSENIISIPMHVEIKNIFPLDRLDLCMKIEKDQILSTTIWQTGIGGNQQIIPVKEGLNITMIKIIGGTFMMGATPEQSVEAEYDEKPTHSVTLSDYWLGETVVTQELWKIVMNDNPSYFKGPNFPVENINWQDCQNFISKLNCLTNKNFRLPTEAEWEFAARGGLKSKGYRYAGSNTLEDVAWYSNNSSNKPHPVKQKQANELGLYDMSGNVLEWCQDWYETYKNENQKNPIGKIGSSRIVRGGSWSSNPQACRVARRGARTPFTGPNNNIGLRLVLDFDNNKKRCIQHVEKTTKEKEIPLIKNKPNITTSQIILNNEEKNVNSTVEVSKRNITDQIGDYNDETLIYNWLVEIFKKHDAKGIITDTKKKVLQESAKDAIQHIDSSYTGYVHVIYVVYATKYVGDEPKGYKHIEVHLNRDKLEELRHVAHIPRKTMYARKLRNTFSIQKYQGQYGIVQNNGQVCGGYSYDDILELESGYLRIKKNGKYGLIRITAQDSLQYIVSCKYDEIIDFKTYQGYMNRFTPYKEKFAWGKLGTHWQLLNEDGKICDPDCRGIQRP